MKYKLSYDSHVKLTIYVDLQFLAKPVTTLTYFQRIPVQEVSPVYISVQLDVGNDMAWPISTVLLMFCCKSSDELKLYIPPFHNASVQ